MMWRSHGRTMSMSLKLDEKRRIERLAELEDTRWYDRYLSVGGLEDAVRAIDEWRRAAQNPADSATNASDHSGW